MDPRVTVLAKWWADVLRQDETNHDAGDAKVNSFTKMFSAMESRPTKEQVDKFEQILATKIEKQLKEPAPYRREGYVHIEVDYDPLDILMDSLAEAGVDRPGRLLFPIKTFTFIDDIFVKVKTGYGAPTKTIYTMKG